MVPANSAVLSRKPTPVSTSAVTPAGPLCTPDNQPAKVVHLVAELAPFARSGGLGEAVASLARFQSASGHSDGDRDAALRHRARQRAGHRAGRPGVPCPGRPRIETRAALAARVEAAAIRSRTPTSSSSRATSTSTARRSTGHRDPTIRTTRDVTRASRMAALQALPTIAGSEPVLLHAHDWHTALAPVYLRTRFAGRRAISAREDGALGAQRRIPGTFPASDDRRPRACRRRSSTGGSSSGTASEHAEGRSSVC